MKALVSSRAGTFRAVAMQQLSTTTPKAPKASKPPKDSPLLATICKRYIRGARLAPQVSGCFSSRLLLQDFIDTHKATLKPPVSNVMLYSGAQLKVMIVGGPNQRDDFHVESGEEFFFQLRGQMNLDVMQMGQRMRMPIKEGCMFVLPKSVPHSPQRQADTIGLVIERARTKDEIDALQWYVPGTNRLLYRETFHCIDLGTQLKPVIERFMGSPEGRRLSSPQAASMVQDLQTEHTLDKYPPAEPEPLIHTSLPTPYTELVEKFWKRRVNPATLVESEFHVSVFKGRLKDEVGVYYPIQSAGNNEIFLFQICGSAEVSFGPTAAAGNADDSEPEPKIDTISIGEVMLLPPPPAGQMYYVRKNYGCELLVVYNKGGL